ncbi:hypothetical protein, partial [Paractinoplanes brasiliensis]|uniref:hypothetical protein n=1 Tax=Paractinoplanes brasiliensis TaxID=52695 RepID=UPI001941DE09
RRVQITGLRGASRWLVIAAAVVLAGLLVFPVQAPEPGGDHPPNMNCGNVFWLTPPQPDRVDPDYEWYRDKMDRGCRGARVTRVVFIVLVPVVTGFGLSLLRRRQQSW